MLLETLPAWVLQRCCLKPEGFLQQGLKALTCSVETFDTNKAEIRSPPPAAITWNLSARTSFHLDL